MCFLGERSDIPEVLPLFDVYVISSVREGLPMALLEALASSRPVVATRVGGIPNVIDHLLDIVDEGEASDSESL